MGKITALVIVSVSVIILFGWLAFLEATLSQDYTRCGDYSQTQYETDDVPVRCVDKVNII